MDNNGQCSERKIGEITQDLNVGESNSQIQCSNVEALSPQPVTHEFFPARKELLDLNLPPAEAQSEGPSMQAEEPDLTSKPPSICFSFGTNHQGWIQDFMSVDTRFINYHEGTKVNTAASETSELSRDCSTGKRRKTAGDSPRDGKSEKVPVPFPWATDKRATIHSLDHLTSMQIKTITGTVQCKSCEQQFDISYNLQAKVKELEGFVLSTCMHNRAVERWLKPTFPKCKFCGKENTARPVIASKKRAINWLFLLLGEMLGCLTLKQLKYFCKHTKSHRTGARKFLLYYTYIGLLDQLIPDGRFARAHIED